MLSIVRNHSPGSATDPTLQVQSFISCQPGRSTICPHFGHLKTYIGSRPQGTGPVRPSGFIGRCPQLGHFGRNIAILNRSNITPSFQHLTCR